MLRPLFCSGILTIAWVNLAPVCLAVPLESVPNPRRTHGGWVTDMANMLAPATETQLNRQISALEARNSHEIAVVTVPDIAPSTNVKAFATQLFNTWGIGKRGKNNGVLFFVSKADRRVEIITGQGLKISLPDSQISTILRQKVTPKFKQRQFDAGILAGTNHLIEHIRRDRPAPQAGNPSRYQKQSAISELATTPPTRPRKVQPTFSNVTPQAPQPEAIAEPNQLTTLMFAALGGLGISSLSLSGILLYRRLNRVVLAPEGESRVEKSAITGQEQFHCATCKQRMRPLTAGELSLFLSQPQQTAQQLGSVVYEGWRCQPCQSSLYGRGFHLRALVMDAEQFSHCPTCDELTATYRSVVIQQPTWNQEGKLQLTHQCRCCSNQWQTEATIACLPLPKDAVTLDPIGRSRVHNFHLFQQAESERPTHCLQCHYPMEQVSSEQLKPHLQKPERVAQYLGSVSFTGWQCPTCYPNADATEMHVRAYVLSSRYHNCPDCQELTVEQTSRTVQRATSESEGRRQITRWCHCCSFMDERWETIPRLASTSSDESSISSWSSDDSCSSSWSSSDSSSSSWSSDDSCSSGWSSNDSSSSSWSSSDSSSSSWSSSDSSSSSDFGGGSSSDSGSGDSW